MNETRRTAIAAGIIFAAFLAVVWFLPDIMMAAGGVSPVLAGAVVVVFLLGVFALLWLRSRTKGR